MTRLVSETGWLPFWGLFALLAGLEVFLPAVQRPAERGQRWPTNMGLSLVVTALVSLAPFSVLVAAEWAHRTNTGLLNSVDPPWMIAALGTIAIYSLGSYASHVLMHKVPLLWKLHRVHHLDPHLDVSTTLRHHPAEFVIGTSLMVPVTIAFGLTPSVIIGYAVVEGLSGALSHANLRLPPSLDRVLRWVFITPNMHCIHHSSHQPETDSNYGQVISVWDRLFGTYNAGSSAEEFGLREIRDDRAASFWWQIKSPLLHLNAEVSGSDASSSLPSEQGPCENIGGSGA